MHAKFVLAAAIVGLAWLAACGDDEVVDGAGGSQSSTSTSTVEYCHEEPQVQAACEMDHPNAPLGCVCAPTAGPFGGCSPDCVPGRNADEFCCPDPGSGGAGGGAAGNGGAAVGGSGGSGGTGGSVGAGGA